MTGRPGRWIKVLVVAVNVTPKTANSNSISVTFEVSQGQGKAPRGSRPCL